MKIEDAVEKAMEQAVTPPEASAKTEEDGQVVTSSDTPQLNDKAADTEDKGQADGSKAPEVKESPVWDGDINKLPNDLQEHAKKVQRYITKHTTEAAELKKKVAEYEATLNGEELKQFRSWQQQQKANPPQTVEASIEDGTISQQEWEDALLDLSGQKVSAILKRSIKAEVDRARAEAMREMDVERQKENSIKSWETRIAEFAEIHPDFVEFHKMGVMKPMLKETLARGGTLEEAYATVKSMVESIRGTERSKLNGSIEEKKSLTSVDKTTKVKSETIWVDSSDEALDTLIGNAIDKKPIGKVKVRSKK